MIALGRAETSDLGDGFAISALTLAELARGPVVATDPLVRARRQERVRTAGSVFEVLAFDTASAHAFEHVCAEVWAVGRKPGGARSIDLMIASTALARGLPLYTRNAADLRGLERLVEIVGLG